MLVNPFLNTTNTLLAPHRSAEVAQSNAVSPAPSTITLQPSMLGKSDLHEHMPAQIWHEEQIDLATFIEQKVEVRFLWVTCHVDFVVKNGEVHEMETAKLV